MSSPKLSLEQYEKLVQFHHRLFTERKRMELDVVDFCNIGCRLCVRGCELKSPNIKRGMLSISDIRKFLEESESCNIKWNKLRIVGGEPTLHPDIIEIIDIINEYKDNHNKECQICFYSNGITEKTKNIIDILRPRVHKMCDTMTIGKKQIKKTECSTERYPNFYSPYIRPNDIGLRSAVEIGYCFVLDGCGLGFSASTGYTICCDVHNLMRLRGDKSEMKTIKDLMDPQKFIDQMIKYCSICGVPLKVYGTVMSNYWIKVFSEKHNGIDLDKFRRIRGICVV